MEPEITKMLTVSYAHVSESTAKNIREWATMESEYGALIYTKEFLAETFPPDLRTLVIMARSLDCDYLHLDRDGRKLPGMPTYDW